MRGEALGVGQHDHRVGQRARTPPRSPPPPPASARTPPARAPTRTGCDRRSAGCGSSPRCSRRTPRRRTGRRRSRPAWWTRSTASSAPASTSWTCSGACAFTKAKAVSIESASISTARALGGQQGGHGVEQPGIGRDQHRLGARAVLELGQQIPGQRLGGRRRVGDDDELARPGQRLDPDLAEQAPLGLLDVGVPRPGHEVDRAASARSRAPARPPPGRRRRRTPPRPRAGRTPPARSRAGSPSGPGGEHTAIPGTPATWAGTIAITALDG